MSAIEAVKARYPSARMGSLKIFHTKNYAVFEGKTLEHMISMGWWSTKNKAWESARALLETVAEGSTK